MCPSDTSRSASVDSSKNTFLSHKPLTNSYASLFKNDKVEDINSDDDIVKMMDEMMNIRKEMTTNTKHKDDIEEQIKKLKKELEQVEKKISDNKDQLKDLATKVADI